MARGSPLIRVVHGYVKSLLIQFVYANNGWYVHSVSEISCVMAHWGVYGFIKFEVSLNLHLSIVDGM